MIGQLDIPELLRSLPLFQPLNPAHLAKVAQRSRERKLSRNEAVFQKGDVPHSIFVIVYGQVKLALPAANGNEKVVELVGPLQCFGEVAVLAESAYPVLAQAVSDTLLVQISKEAILDLLEADPPFSRRLLACMAKRTHTLIQDVEAYTQQTSAQRVVSFLQQHCLDTDPSEDDRIQVTLPASKQVIASRLKMTPETLSRVFNELICAELIDVQGKKITIRSIKRLQAFEEQLNTCN